MSRRAIVHARESAQQGLAMQPEVHPETGDEDAAGDCMPALVAGRRQRQRCAQAAEHADLGGAVDTVVDREPCLSRGGECRIQGLFDPLLKLGGAYLAVVKKNHDTSRDKIRAQFSNTLEWRKFLMYSGEAVPSAQRRILYADATRGR